MDINGWFKKYEAVGEADMPVLAVEGRILTPREVLVEINGPLGDQIKRQMGW